MPARPHGQLDMEAESCDECHYYDYYDDHLSDFGNNLEEYGADNFFFLHLSRQRSGYDPTPAILC